jgi:hypothetical protein
MTPTTTVPFTITDEATEYIRKLGLQGPFERMIEHTKEAVPGLLKIHVWLQPAYDIGCFDGINIDAEMEDRHLEDDPTGREWDRWVIENFPPEVHQYFCLFAIFGGPNARP